MELSCWLVLFTRLVLNIPPLDTWWILTSSYPFLGRVYCIGREFLPVWYLIVELDETEREEPNASELENRWCLFHCFQISMLG